VWFQDEARVGQKNTLTRVWGQTGSRPAAPRDLGFASAYLFGAVCPSEGKAAALIMPICNTAAMNHHLSEISSQVAVDAHAVVILDRAGWHRSQAPQRVHPLRFRAGVEADAAKNSAQGTLGCSGARPIGRSVRDAAGRYRRYLGRRCSSHPDTWYHSKLRHLSWLCAGWPRSGWRRSDRRSSSSRQRGWHPLG